MKLIITRHGQTCWNAQSRTQGRTDIPLDDIGLLQAEYFGKRLCGMAVSAIYSSPLSRAVMTAAPAGRLLGLPVIPDDRLIERNFGAWEGRVFSELKTDFPELWRLWRQDPENCLPPEAESIADVQARCMDFLADIWKKYPNKADAVVIVCHSIPARLMLAALIGLPLSRFQSFLLSNASYTEVSCENGENRIVVLNDTNHLPKETLCM